MTASALVLGSTQSLDVVDADACAAAGVEVVRRRSGGGAVLVEPGRVLWVDVWLPAGDPLWVDDVGRSALWLGAAWAAALAAAGVGGGEVHSGPLVTTRWSPLVCFAGLGSGEVTVEGAKVVGIAQRRSREGARFQCAVPLAWSASAILGLLALPEAERARGFGELAAVVHPISPDLAEPVVTALAAALP